MNETLQSEIAAKFKSSYDLLAIRYPMLVSKLPFSHIRLTFKRIGKTAGRAYLRFNRIELNPDYFQTERENMINDTLPHELCHLVAYTLFGDSGHGVYWKQCMNVVGLTANRCHNYNTSVATLRHHRKFIYTCECKRNISVGLNIHKKIGMGIKYTCNKCSQTLKFVKNSD
jgi:SprT protein